MFYSFFAKILIDRRITYVFSNVLISGLGFLRNVMFMRLMGQDDLGQIALMQTISMSVGLLHFGLINGGYRIYAGSNSKFNRHVNDNVFTCLTLLAGILLIGLLVLRQMSPLIGASVHFETVAFGIASGIVSLTSTWTNNTLVAEGRLGMSNLINLGAASSSLLVAFLAGEMGLHFALISVFAQPIVVTVLALFFNPTIRPRPAISKKILQEILALGFFPFCSGILTLVNMQIERWFIVFGMGTEPLGQYYIVMIYATIFSLVPASLLNLFYPQAIRAYEQGEQSKFLTIVRRHLTGILLYITVLVVSTGMFLGWALNTFLVKFIGQEWLIFLSLPGLVALTFFDSAALVLQSIRKMLPLFLFSTISLVVNIALLAGAVTTNKLTLEFVVIAKSASYITASLLIIIPLYLRRKHIFQILD